MVHGTGLISFLEEMIYAFKHFLINKSPTQWTKLLPKNKKPYSLSGSKLPSPYQNLKTKTLFPGKSLVTSTSWIKRAMLNSSVDLSDALVKLLRSRAEKGIT